MGIKGIRIYADIRSTEERIQDEAAGAVRKKGANMAGTSISEYGLGIAPAANLYPGKSVSAKGSDYSFQEVMAGAGGGAAASGKEPVSAADTNNTVDATESSANEEDMNKLESQRNRAEETRGKEEPAEEQTASIKPVEDEVQESAVRQEEAELTEEQLELIGQSLARLIDTLCNQLGISKEQLMEALQAMDLSLGDLLKPENLTALVVNLKADGDFAALLTQEELPDLIGELSQHLEEQMKQLEENTGLSETDLKGFLSEGLVSAEEEVQMSGALASKVPDVDAAKSEQVIGNDASPIAPTEVQTKSNPSEEEASQGNGQAMGEQHAANGEGVFTAAQFAEGLEQVVDLDSPVESMSRASDIFRQLAQQIRTSVTPELTSIQMQLNPENLGSVGLTVTMKEGVMTAHFTTQNEAVQAAIEAQLQQLKENLQQQGVRVEAVEVTVASHEFEQNLEQGNDQNAQEQEEAERLRKATRRIDLSDWYGEGEAPLDLEPEELVTAQMMQADGNRMDYKV